MQNIKSNHDNFLPLVKESLKEIVLPDGDFQCYKNKPKLAHIEIVTLAVLIETLGRNSENHFFSYFKTKYFTDFVNIPDRSNFNRRR